MRILSFVLQCRCIQIYRRKYRILLMSRNDIQETSRIAMWSYFHMNIGPTPLLCRGEFNVTVNNSRCDRFAVQESVRYKMRITSNVRISSIALYVVIDILRRIFNVRLLRLPQIFSKVFCNTDCGFCCEC